MQSCFSKYWKNVRVYGIKSFKVYKAKVEIKSSFPALFWRHLKLGVRTDVKLELGVVPGKNRFFFHRKNKQK